MSNVVQALIFDRYGREPTLVEPAFNYIAWRHNRTGQAVLALPYTDPNCNKTLLRYGNRVLIQMGNGLPNFGGVVDVPMQRTDTGISFTVYTGDRILSWRRSAKIRSFTSTSPGTIFETLLDDANAQSPTGISAVSVSAAGEPRTQEYNYAPLGAAIEELLRYSGEEFVVLPVFTQGQLKFEAYWEPTIGHDLSLKVLLEDGENVRDVAVDEQGTIASDIYVAGGSAGGTEWTDRFVGTDTNVASRIAYGFREHAEILTGVFDQATLDATAVALAAELNNPRPHLKCTAANVSPSPFDQYNVGDIVTVHAYIIRGEWAIDATMRLYGREWSPDNTCRLELL